MGKNMIGIVNLNLATDKIYIIKNFKTNDVVRPDDMIANLGGKGINVARVLKALGKDPQIISFAGKENLNIINKRIKKENFDLITIITEGESRECIIIGDPVTNKQTIINEKGIILENRDLVKLKTEFRKFCSNKKLIIFSGSVPQGAPSNIYAVLIRIAKNMKITCFLDTSGQFLEEGIKAKPYMMKPNIFELQDITREKFKTINNVAERALELSKSGIAWVIVSMCEKGVIYCTGGKCYHALIPLVKMKSAVGSGDSLVAGFAYSHINKFKIEDTIRFSTACAVANSLSVEPGKCKKRDILNFVNKIKIINI